MDKPEEVNKNLNIELSEEIAEGVYANLAMIAHSSSEFVIDYIRLMPGVPKAKVKARIVITPEHAKRLLYALEENIQKYEKTFGEIKIMNSHRSFQLILEVQ
jgi:hypothetical protein